MLRNLVLTTVAATLLLLPGKLSAGGPPWLSLPIDGVTAENADDCTKLLSKALNRPIEDSGLEMVRDGDQWYLGVYIREEVTLSEIEAALKNSAFRVPRDQLRFFGHVILEIESRKFSADELLKDLENLEYVSVAKSVREPGLLRVTVDMPYPPIRGRGSIESDTFHWTDFSSDQSARSEGPATARELPSYNDFRDVVTKHNAKLKDIRWSAFYRCRPLGCVAVPGEKAEVKR